MKEDGEWPVWACVLTTAIILALPFLLILRMPVWAAVGWLAAVLAYVLSLAVFGKGHVLEGAVAAFILAVLIAMLIPKIHDRLEHKQGTANNQMQNIATNAANSDL